MTFPSLMVASQDIWLVEVQVRMTESWKEKARRLRWRRLVARRANGIDDAILDRNIPAGLGITEGKDNVVQLPIRHGED